MKSLSYLYECLSRDQILVLAGISGEAKSGKYRLFYSTDLKKRKDLSSIDVDKILNELEEKGILQKDGKKRWKVIKNKIEHDAKNLITLEKLEKIRRL